MPGELVVFYAWQSDLPSRGNRGVISEALSRALKALGRDDDVQHALRMDKDTQGVPGSPDIADAILTKIRACDAFVADVTLREGGDRVGPNPNVMVELGYAARELGWDRVILVMNLAYGNPEKLPFDLRGRRVLTYRLGADDKPAAPRALLVDALCRALKVSQPRSENKPIEPQPTVRWKGGESPHVLTVIPSAPVAVSADTRRLGAVSDAEIAELSSSQQEAAKAYNVAIEEHHNSLEALRDEENIYLRCERYGTLVFVALHNSGRAPLHSAVVQLRFPEGFHVYEQGETPGRPDVPRAPRRPRLGPRLKPLRIPMGAIMVTNQAEQDWLTTLSNISSFPVTLRHSGMYLVGEVGTARVDDLKHNFSITFDDPLVLVPPPEAGEYEVSVEVHADNLADPCFQTLLIVVVENADPETHEAPDNASEKLSIKRIP